MRCTLARMMTFIVVAQLGEEIMSYAASIYSHTYNPPIRVEVLLGIFASKTAARHDHELRTIST